MTLIRLHFSVVVEAAQCLLCFFSTASILQRAPIWFFESSGGPLLVMQKKISHWIFKDGIIPKVYISIVQAHNYLITCMQWHPKEIRVLRSSFLEWYFSFLQDYEVPIKPLDDSTLCCIQEEFANFLVSQVIDKKGEFHCPNPDFF